MLGKQSGKEHKVKAVNTIDFQGFEKQVKGTMLTAGEDILVPHLFLRQ